MNIIYAIPGLGTTSELYRNISVENYQLRVLEWPTPEKKIKLRDYAAKFLKQLPQDEPLNLLGVSFGGMLCAELAQMLPVNKVFLVSSAKNSREFPWLLKAVRLFPIYRLFPEKLIRAIVKTKRKFIGFEKSFEPVFLDMIDRMPAGYFSCCIDYIVNWDRKKNETELVQIHGTADRLLTHKTIKKYYEIRNGSHAMILSDAAEINSILTRELNGLS